MVEYNFTDDQVIKALECCEKGCACSSCPLKDDYSPCSSSVTHLALSLINKQKTDLDLLKSTITHKEEEAYNKGYEDGKADMQSEVEEWVDRCRDWHEVGELKCQEVERLHGILLQFTDIVHKWGAKNNIDTSEISLIPILQEEADSIIKKAKSDAAREILMHIKALMQIIILDYKEIGAFDNAEIVGYVRDHLLTELEKRHAEGIKKE